MVLGHNNNVNKWNYSPKQEDLCLGEGTSYAISQFYVLENSKTSTPATNKKPMILSISPTGELILEVSLNFYYTLLQKLVGF